VDVIPVKKIPEGKRNIHRKDAKYAKERKGNLEFSTNFIGDP